MWQLADVFDIRRRTEIDGKQVSSRMEFDEEYGQEYYYLLASENGTPIGTVRVNFNNTNFGKIERVSVTSKYQHSGYGTKLISAAEDWLLEKKFNHVVITSLPSAKGFYEKLGYKETKTVDAPNRTLSYMEKDLK